jgi:hypothetical protein
MRTKVVNSKGCHAFDGKKQRCLLFLFVRKFCVRQKQDASAVRKKKRKTNQGYTVNCK